LDISLYNNTKHEFISIGGKVFELCGQFYPATIGQSYATIDMKK